MKKIGLIILLSWIMGLSLNAQIPDFVNTGANSGSGTPPQNSTFTNVFPDSVPVHYFYANDPNKLFALDDTLLNTFQQYDPIRLTDYFDFYTVGDVGHPHQALFYQPIIREGFHFGFDQYQLFQWENDEVRYFSNPKAYTEAYYSQTSSQDEFIFKALASIKVSKSINAAVNFRRIRQEGEYQRQSARHGNLSVSAWYHSKDKRHKAYLSYLSNNLFQYHNGGIIDISELYESGTFASRSQIAVNLAAAETETAHQQFTLTNYFSLNRAPQPIVAPISPPNDSLFKIDSLLKTDSIQPPKPITPKIKTTTSKKANLLVMHQVSYDTKSYKFFDSSPPKDSAVYGNFMVDERGLRNFVSYRALENVFKIRLAYQGNLDVGLRHKIFFINQEPRDTTINNLFLVGDWTLDTKKDNFGLNVKARFGILDNGADYLLDANGFLKIGKIGRLEGRVMSQRYSPSLMQHQLYLSQQKIWENNFSKPIETSLMAAFVIPRTKTTIQVQNHLINNLIYYDTLALAKQETGAVNILQLLVSQNFKIGAFHSDNTVGVQQVSNTNVLHYPRLVSKHSLYFEGHVFKRAAFAKLGFDIRYNTDYYADNFQPATGQFFLQNHTPITYVPQIDAFLSAKVQTFRGFIKVENLNELLFSNSLLPDLFPTSLYTFTAPQYPIRNWTIRFGIHWRFYD